MRYIEIEFRPGGKRYVYHHAGDEVIEAGIDRVEIPTNDTGPCVFKVLSVTDQEPGRETRPIRRVLVRAPTTAGSV